MKKKVLIISTLIVISVLAIIATIIMTTKRCEENQIVNVKKPVLYLYPEEDNTNITVNLSVKNNNKEIFTYPLGTIQEGIDTPDTFCSWDCVVNTDGLMKCKVGYDLETGRYKSTKECRYLFWETLMDVNIDEWNYCIEGDKIVPFLEETLKMYGLNDIEAADFITYWAPILSQNKYNLITFKSDYVQHAKYNFVIHNGNEESQVCVQPDTFIRVFMVYQSCDDYIKLPSTKVTLKQKRQGFTAVEWGGGEFPKG